MTREQIQQEALQALIDNKGGTLVLSTGTGKCKVSIDFLKWKRAANILITSPRNNLKENWKKELYKWNIYNVKDNEYSINGSCLYTIQIENIQTCYKWNKEKIQVFDLVIVDEIHTGITSKYGNLIKSAKEAGVVVIGLTATPDDRKLEKKLFYQHYCPIVYKYTDSAKDGITNKTRYIIYEHQLSENHLIPISVAGKKWYSSEVDQYKYYQNMVDIGKREIESFIPSLMTSINHFAYAKSWFWDKSTTNKDKINAGRKYIQGITGRKNLLWNLQSNVEVVKSMLYVLLKDANNKILVFSELTNQVEKITTDTIHSNNDKEINSQRLEAFNNGELKVLGSCQSLTLGLNMNKPNIAIMESYNSSLTNFKQKTGKHFALISLIR